MMRVLVNGKERDIEGPVDMTSFLESLGISLTNIAVAHNETVLRAEELAGVTLSEGDRVEIVRAVGGG